MRSGIFGGTFNPVHNGHIAACNTFIKEARLDRVFVFAAGTPPHKSYEREVSDEARLDMLRLALPNAVIDDYEIRHGGKSYTVNTVEYLSEKYPDDELFLYMGSDMILCLETVWYRFEDILKLTTVFVASRYGDDIEALESHIEKLREKYNAKIMLSKAKPVVVSSTDIRETLHSHSDATGLLPESVLTYINERGLYR